MDACSLSFAFFEGECENNMNQNVARYLFVALSLSYTPPRLQFNQNGISFLALLFGRVLLAVDSVFGLHFPDLLLLLVQPNL